MRYFAITLVSLALLASCKTVQMSHGAIEKQTTHIHSEMGGWEIFEVSSRGQGGRSMSDNAKMKLVDELIRYGYRGTVTITPLLTNPKALRMYEQSDQAILSNIIKDKQFIKQHSKEREGRIGSRKLKQKQATILLKVHPNNIRRYVNNYYESN
ncbi:MAG: hypothetical protein WBK97_06865 [Bacteroidales bacterium]|jgi:hypothetical protein